MKKRQSHHTVVIGGTRGIGRAVVDLFVADGHRVSVLARHLPDYKGHANVRYYAVDVAQADSLKTTLSEVVKQIGTVSNLIFLQRFRGEGDPWCGEWGVSANATKTAIDQLRNHFVRDGTASIVIVSSNASRLIADEQPISYHVGKAALRQVARYYACELGSCGIRVNCVSPGTTLKAESKDFFLKDKSLQALYRKVCPLCRMGRAEEVASVIGFLSSSQASFVTGQDIVVDGGFSLLLQESLARKAAGLVRRHTGSANKSRA